MSVERTPHSAQDDIAEIRDTLRANSVNRYGRYERENTYGALDALKRLEKQVAHLRSEAERSEKYAEERDQTAQQFEAALRCICDSKYSLWQADEGLKHLKHVACRAISRRVVTVKEV